MNSSLCWLASSDSFSSSPPLGCGRGDMSGVFAIKCNRLKSVSFFALLKRPSRNKTADTGSIYNSETLLPNFSLLHLIDRKSTRLNSSHVRISYAVFCLKKKKKTQSDH